MRFISFPLVSLLSTVFFSLFFSCFSLFLFHFFSSFYSSFYFIPPPLVSLHSIVLLLFISPPCFSSIYRVFFSLVSLPLFPPFLPCFSSHLSSSFSSFYTCFFLLIPPLLSLLLILVFSRFIPPPLVSLLSVFIHHFFLSVLEKKDQEIVEIRLLMVLQVEGRREYEGM